jgi:hypothetical protein
MKDGGPPAGAAALDRQAGGQLTRHQSPSFTLLESERRPEQCHDPIAHHLVDGALVTVDGLHHQLEDGIEDLACFLGIAVGQQFHRALQVGEQHGDLLALALKRGLGDEDLLGEVLRCVGAGGIKLWSASDRHNGLAAGEAEPCLAR